MEKPGRGKEVYERVRFSVEREEKWLKRWRQHGVQQMREGSEEELLMSVFVDCQSWGDPVTKSLAEFHVVELI